MKGTGKLPEGFDLDSLLTLDEAAAWLGLNRRDLSAKSRGRKAAIPAIRINRQVIRFHPRTILAKFASDAGVPPDVIAASMALVIEKPQKGEEKGRHEI